MSRSVWLIEEGEYSDYHIVGVFSSKKKAEQVLAKIKGGPDNYNDPEVVEWVLDPAVAEIRAGLDVFHVTMLLDGTVERINRAGWSSNTLDQRVYLWERTKALAYLGIPGGKDAVRATVFARDEQHAIKIANEKRVQLLAARGDA